MKVNRFVAVAMIGLLAIGAMGVISTRSFAKAPSAHIQQAQVAQTAPNDPPEESQALEEAPGVPDTDAIEEQVEDGGPEGAEPPGTEDVGPDEQSPSYSSSIAVDQTVTEGMSEADEAAALASQARISLEEANATALAANPGATILQTELDNENGALVYSVELSNGSDVKVDAGNGVVLHTETGEDHEG